MREVLRRFDLAQQIGVAIQYLEQGLPLMHPKQLAVSVTVFAVHPVFKFQAWYPLEVPCDVGQQGQ